MAPLLDLRLELQANLVRVEYLRPLTKYAVEKPYLLALDIPLADESERTNLEFEEIVLNPADARSVRGELSLEKHGFTLVTLEPELMTRYFRQGETTYEMEGVKALLDSMFCPQKVIIFDHAYRKEQGKETDSEYSFYNRPPESVIVRNPHADQSTTSGSKRVETFLTSEEQKLYTTDKWRIQIVNFWKPKFRKIQRAPLLLCDSQSIAPEDIIPCDMVSSGYVGESLLLTHSSRHSWFWFQDQDVNEALLFVSYDSARLGEMPTGCFHSSCDIVDERLSVPSLQEGLRESLEVRALIITSIG